MSSYERRRCLRIVDEIQGIPTQQSNQQVGNSQPVADIQSSGREEEIIGGLRNALERGADLQSAKQSFINAGYSSSEVESAVQKVPSISSRVSKRLPEVNCVKKSKVSKDENVRPDVYSKSEGKSASKGMVIALIVMGVLVVAGGVAVYLFRDKLF